MTSQHSAPDGFSPLFSNATIDQTAPGQHIDQPTAEQKRSIQKRSELNGDHHLRFHDLDDSAPAGSTRP